MLSNYVIAIPSYNRHNEIINKTLTTLLEGSVNKNKIYIFVANKTQEQLYLNTIPKSLYHKIVVGKIGIANQRVFISNYFPINQYIVSLDDDVEEIQYLKGDKLIKLRDLDTFFKDAYKVLTKEKLYIWGVYPVRNAFFMYNTISTDLKFIIGVTFGYINRKLKKLIPKAEGKEDIEQSILYYKMDGGVVRFNNIVPKTKFNAPGGLGIDRYEMNKKAADFLQQKYPDIVTLFHRKNGMPEVRLARLPRIL